MVTFQCRIYSVLSEQTASCSHSRIHESKDYQSWRDPWGLITPVQPFILKMGEIRPKERKWRSAAKLALRPRVQTLKSGPARTVPLRKAEFMRVKWLAKGGAGERKETHGIGQRDQLCEPPLPPPLLSSATQGRSLPFHVALISRAFLLNFI